MIKINREFCITDNSVNCYGYRLLTEGLDLSKFVPPVGFLMHNRDKGVAVVWTDFHVEGDALFATPTVNDTAFPTLAREIEEGFYCAASVGHIVALEWSDDPKDKLPGQDGPTVTRWYPRECSIVDIPGNPNALARLYDENDNILHDLSAKTNITDMNKINLSDLGLSEEITTAEQLRSLIDDLKQRAGEADTLRAQNAELVVRVAELETNQRKEQVKAIIADALADHRFGQATADVLAADYAERPDELQALVDTFAPKQKINVQPANQEPAPTWDELDRRGELLKLKQEDPAEFQRLYEQKFGKKNA